MKKLVRLIKKIFTRFIRIFSNDDPVYCVNYRKYFPREKSGGDIIGDFPVPTSDTLYYTIYEGIASQYLVTKIKTKFFFIIPFTYAEYIIKFNGTRYPDGEITAEQACEEIHNADYWNHRTDLHPMDIGNNLRFVGPDGCFDYVIGDNDYSAFKYDHP